MSGSCLVSGPAQLDQTHLVVDNALACGVAEEAAAFKARKPQSHARALVVQLGYALQQRKRRLAGEE